MAQIKIQDIFPLLKPGWVAMDKNGIWRWYAIKPRISYDMWYRGGCSIVKISDCFDLLLFEGDWKDSLMEVRKYARTSRTKGHKMITIDQLLESVDLYFEPRWVTKDKDGTITIFKTKPKKGYDVWAFGSREEYFILNKFKVAEFADKPWQECIYEVPRKEELKDKIKIGTLYIDKSVTFGDGDDDDVGVALEDYEVPRKTTGKIEKLDVGYKDSFKIKDWQDIARTVERTINELVDAVNELKSGSKNVQKQSKSGSGNVALDWIKGAKNE